MAAKYGKRDYCFTINNPPQDFEVREAGVRYYIYQLESGEEGTLHIQGFIQFNSVKTPSAAKKFIGYNAHVEGRRGSVAQAIAYCKKQDTRQADPVEFGRSSGGQGSRTDLVIFKDAVVSGKRKRELLDDFTGIMIRYRHAYSDIQLLVRPDRCPRSVLLIYGKTGVGKTKAVWDVWADKDFWTMPFSRKGIWFDGYDGNECVLMDDFAGGKSGVSLVNLLRLLHEYPEKVEVKGGHVWWNPKDIVITTNVHPNDWYDYKGRPEQRLALKRRIGEVHVYNDDSSFDIAEESWWSVSPEYVYPPST